MFRNYPDVVSVPQLQKMLNIGRNATYTLLNEKKIASIRVGRVHRIPKANVIRYVKSTK